MYMTNTAFSPVRRSIQNTPEFKAWIAASQPMLKERAAIMEYGYRLPPVRQMPQLQVVFKKRIEQAFTEKTDPKKTLDGLVAEMNDILAK